ncbi:MAG: NAD(P)-dependent oxidoreductase [Planctomycetota bacterium]
MRRALVTGAAGFLGHYVARALLARGWEVTGSSRDGAGLPCGVEPAPLSLEDGGRAAAALVAELRPELIVHLAAESDADACARDPERAVLLNAAASRALALAGKQLGARFLFSSTDLVFGGDAPPYREEDPPAPLGPYMASKAAAEALVLGVDPGALVLRVALLYGRRGGRKGSFTDALLARLARGEETPCFVDQRRTPIFVVDAAEAVTELAETDARGRLHLGGPERASRHEHAVALARACGLDPTLCRPTRVAEVAGLAPRPADVSLVTERLLALVSRPPRGIAAGAEAVAAQPAPA